MFPQSSLSSTWSCLTSKLRGSKSSTTSAPRFPGTESKIRADLDADIRADTKAARTRAKKTQANKSPSPSPSPSLQCGTPSLEHRLVVFQECPRFGDSGAESTKSRKKIRYKCDGKPMKFSITDLSAYTLSGREECGAGTPELLLAVDRWLGKGKNRKKRWQFTGTIADGVEKISNRVPSRFGTFVVYVLIERSVQGQGGGGLEFDHQTVEGIAVASHGPTMRSTGKVEEVPHPGSAGTTVDMGKAERGKGQEKVADQRPCRTCGWSTWKANDRCDEIHAV